MKRPGLAVAFLPCALACGGLAAESHGDSGADASSISEGGASISEGGLSRTEAGAAPDASADDAGPESGATYSGMVLASITTSPGKEAYALDTNFWTVVPGRPSGLGDAPSNCGTDGITVGACCEWSVRINLLGSAIAPVAGNVTLDLHGAPLATLLSPAYAQITSATWSAGDALGVSAAGGDVAPFSGTLVTPTMMAGLSPAFGPDPLPIAHDTDFPIAWTPEAKDGELVRVEIESLKNGQSLDISCTVADAVGSIIVDATLLAPLASSTNASIHLLRSITSDVSGPNATVALQGEVWVEDAVTIQ